MVDVTRYGFEGDYQQLYDMVDRYSRERLYPLAERMDRDDWFPEEEVRKLAKIGLLGVTVPEKFGGAGMDTISQCFITEAMSKWNSSLCAKFFSDGIIAPQDTRKALGMAISAALNTEFEETSNGYMRL